MVRLNLSVLALVLASTGACTGARAAETSSLDLGRSDHRLHASISLLATAGGAYGLRSAGMRAEYAPITAAAIVFAAGFAKEALIDSDISVGDLKADALGALTGAALAYTFRF